MTVPREPWILCGQAGWVSFCPSETTLHASPPHALRLVLKGDRLGFGIDMSSLSLEALYLPSTEADRLPSRLSNGSPIDSPYCNRGKQRREEEVVGRRDDDDIVVPRVNVLQHRRGCPSRAEDDDRLELGILRQLVGRVVRLVRIVAKCSQ